MTITAFELAERWIGTKETAGVASNPLVLGMLRLDQSWPGSDDVPWCSAFVNFIAWQLRLPRSKSLQARSWLAVGMALPLAAAVVGWDVVVFRRGTTHGPDVLDAPGHVGFYAGLDNSKLKVNVLGGNQGDSVSVVGYPVKDLLGVRRLHLRDDV